MKIRFFTLFPELIKNYFEYSIMKRAKSYVDVVDFREFADNFRVDTEIAGGGAGMILDNLALRNALNAYSGMDARIVFLTPVGKRFNQKDAKRLAKEDNLFLICGRYEGFDERLIEDFANEVLSIGDFVLSGGELAALSIADSVLRNIEGILGNPESLSEESFENGMLEAPAFSKTGDVPAILKSGNHKLVKDWRDKLSLYKTLFHRPDLLNL
ncbi:MAG: tRNA (guanosine(37)-N1)-methyltransferase TrmD [Epsilonproteobacteria bacterium]|nr:tRNA (guanosine(37)-N1)-methyltransferase TrmD [Campylobacterota bacterium]